MPIVKRSKKWSWRSSPNTPSFTRANRRAYMASALLASWAGTYLDLYFVGKGLYTFPKRPFPSVFSIDIFFTAIVLPLGTVLFLAFMERLGRIGRAAAILSLSALISAFESKAEEVGWFIHTPEWSHWYSLVGYGVFLAMIWKCYRRFQRMD
ncbi:CBO0543 family protein [Geobacillus vulcani]|uniref:CBO0543 family protein n=1 Tax=Geobacillus vulcani TaxID=135517 RepID=UPI0004DF6C42|nr:CBO0543 family protein [Geobacillus vulcani]